MQKKLKIISVLRRAPLQSGFLKDKFIRLSQTEDMHMIVWDSNANINEFCKKNSIAKNKIHRGIYKQVQLLWNILPLIALMLSNSKVRTYLFSSGAFIPSLKKIIAYLPIFFLKPDIIHFEFGTMARDIDLFKKTTSAKLCVSFRGYDINYIGLDNPSYYDSIWENTDGIHFLGNDLKNRAIKRGYKQGTIEAIITPAIDLTFFKPEKRDISSDKFIILSVGRLTWKKGYEYAISAAAGLKKTGLNFEYKIIGSGAHLQALQFMIYELGLSDCVKLLGEKDKNTIKAELNAADVFLQSSVSEGFCNAVIEAQAMGVPVVCTDADGLSENIEPGVTGFIVPKWDADAIANKLEWCYKNRHQLKAIGEKGIQRANKLYSLQTQVEKFKQFYNQLYSAR